MSEPSFCVKQGSELFPVSVGIGFVLGKKRDNVTPAIDFPLSGESYSRRVGKQPKWNS